MCDNDVQKGLEMNANYGMIALAAVIVAIAMIVINIVDRAKQRKAKKEEQRQATTKP